MKLQKTTPPARVSKRTKQLLAEAAGLGFNPLGWIKVDEGFFTIAGLTNGTGGSVLLLTGDGSPFKPMAKEFVSELDGGRWVTTTTFPYVSPQPERGIFKYSHPKTELAPLLAAHLKHIAKLKARPVRRVLTLKELIKTIRDYLRHESGEIKPRPKPAENSLSPAADKFLAAATVEFNAKQAALRKEWRIGSHAKWAFHQIGGTLHLGFRDGAELVANGQILGSYSKKGASWEWAWNNPNVLPTMARDSQTIKRLGKKLKISYLLTGMVPVPNKQFATYLSAIGVKATKSAGLFQAPAGDIDVMIGLKRPRWKKTKNPRKRSKGGKAK